MCSSDLKNSHPDLAPVTLARLLRRHTPMSRHWIADRLHMGSASYVTKLTANPKASIDYEN